MGKHDATAKKIHLTRTGDDLTKCGRKYGWVSDGTKSSLWFTNPAAKLCEQCENLATADGLTVTVTWVPNTSRYAEAGTGHWRVSATPPMLRLYQRGSFPVIVDQNDPEAPSVTITHDVLESILDQRSLGILYDEFGTPAPQPELTS